MHIKLSCEYIGTNFFGFQKQPKGRTVQGELENAISKYFGSEVKIVGSGRTDSGVHARMQVISFLCPWEEVNLHKMMMAINCFLPEDVSVNSVEIMQKFNARAEAKIKTYVYNCYVSATRSATRDATFHQIYKPLDIVELRKQAAEFIGTHDFTSFCSELAGKNPNRTIYSFDVDQNQDEIKFTVRGASFLKNMVRIMVGTLLGGGDVKEILKKRNRKFAGKTAPAKGLTLYSVEY